MTRLGILDLSQCLLAMQGVNLNLMTACNAFDLQPSDRMICLFDALQSPTSIFAIVILPS